MSPIDDEARALSACFPRVSGDEPVLLLAGLVCCLFSPRERG